MEMNEMKYTIRYENTDKVIAHIEDDNLRICGGMRVRQVITADGVDMYVDARGISYSSGAHGGFLSEAVNW